VKFRVEFVSIGTPGLLRAETSRATGREKGEDAVTKNGRSSLPYSAACCCRCMRFDLRRKPLVAALTIRRMALERAHSGK